MRLKPIAVLTHAAAGAALAACALDPNAVAPRYATRLEDLPALQPAAPTAPPSAPTAADPTPSTPDAAPPVAPSSSAPVTVSALPPPVATVAASPVSEPQAAPPVAPPTPARAPASVPAARAVSAPPRTHVVQPGDTLYGLARRYGSTVAVLRTLNDLPESGALRAGQRLKLPDDPAAPTSVAAPGGPGPVGVERSAAEVAYAVRAGDTLSGVSRRFRVTLGEIQALNGLAPDAPLKAGQIVKLPNGVVDGGPETYAQGVSPEGATPAAAVGAQARPPEVAPRPAPSPAARPAPATSTTATAPSTPPTQSPAETPARPAAPTRPAPGPAVPVPAAPAPDAGTAAVRGQGRFDWPVRGEVVGRFGAQGVGLRNDGINIAASDGDPVRAAAAGEVVYAGDSVPGFGNLVLLKHAEGWVTAYAHLGRISVKMREQVTQGQQVGTVGTSGGLTSPQLHFEVRYAPTPQDRARPIDPLTVLPAR